MLTSVYFWIGVGVYALCLLAFLLLAYRDLGRLLFRGGAHRTWALARNAFLEAWAAKVWVVPILWLGACLILTLLVQPYDERERTGLHLRIYLQAQEYLVLIVLAMLACFSLPRERERRTIMTTASKPISRLELFLGKILGFAGVGAGLLLSMGAVTYIALQITDLGVRRRMDQEYHLKLADIEESKRGPLIDSMKNVAEHGTLQAENYVTAHSGMQVAGAVYYQQDEVQRWLKGGSEEKLIFRLPPLWMPAGYPVRFSFGFIGVPTEYLTRRQLTAVPPQIEIFVSVSPVGNAGRVVEQKRALEWRQLGGGGMYVGNWEPDQEHLFVNTGRPVEVRIGCATKDVYLLVSPSVKLEETNVLATSVDANLSRLVNVGPLAAPLMHGFEKRDLQQIEGPPFTTPIPRLETLSPQELAAYSAALEVAIWRFRAADLARVPRNPDGKTFNLGLLLDLDKYRNQSLPTYAILTVWNDLTRDRRFITTFPVLEKRLNEISIPAEYLRPDLDLLVDLRCATPAHWIGAKDDSVRLQQPSSPFLANLFKSEAVILAEALLLIVIAVTASVRLGGWVALLATGTAYLLGNLMDFVERVAAGGSDSIFSAMDRRELQGTLFYQSLENLQVVSVKMVYFIMHLLPDFRIFEPLQYIADARNMPWNALGSVVGGALLYALPCIALAYLLIRKQETA